MSISDREVESARARHIEVTEDTLSADLVDGRTISVPLGYPRLSHAARKEQSNWRLIQGQGIHWPDLDEDVNALLVARSHALENSAGHSPGSACQSDPEPCQVIRCPSSRAM
jgi:hypothetical protein